MRQGSRTDAARGSRTDAARNESQPIRKPITKESSAATAAGPLNEDGSDNHPWQLLERVQTRLGAAAADIPRRALGRHLAAAKRLREQYGADEVLACVEWMLTVPFLVNRGVTILWAEEEMANYQTNKQQRANGRPAVPAHRAANPAVDPQEFGAFVRTKRSIS